MKVNRKVSDLARKLEYIGVNLKDRRKVIKNCLNPLDAFLFGSGKSIIKDINNSYEYLKKEMDELERQRIAYENLNGKDKEYFREIRYIALQN